MTQISPRARRARRSRGRGAADRAGLRAGAAPTAGDPERLREIAAAARARARTPTASTAGSARPRRSSCCADAGIAVPDGRVAADADDAVAVAARARLAGGDEALGALAAPQDRGRRAGAGAFATRTRSARPIARLRSLPAAGGAEVLVERMAGRGIEVFVAARADGVVPALAIGLGGIWTEALDDVAIVPLPADARESSARCARCAAPPLLDRRPRPRAVDLAAPRRARRPGRRAARSTAGWRCWS